MFAFIYQHWGITLVFFVVLLFEFIRIIGKCRYRKVRKLETPKSVIYDDVVIPHDVEITIKGDTTLIRKKSDIPVKNKSIALIIHGNGYIFYPDNKSFTHNDENGRFPGYLPLSLITLEAKLWLLDNITSMDTDTILARYADDKEKTKKHWLCIPLLDATQDLRIRHLYTLIK